MSIVGFTDGDAENGDGPREYVTSEATAPLINAQEFVQTPCCVVSLSLVYLGAPSAPVVTSGGTDWEPQKGRAICPEHRIKYCP